MANREYVGHTGDIRSTQYTGKGHIFHGDVGGTHFGGEGTPINGRKHQWNIYMRSSSISGDRSSAISGDRSSSISSDMRSSSISSDMRSSSISSDMRSSSISSDYRSSAISDLVVLESFRLQNRCHQQK